jgi:glycosyltransferase involved in cell wall biosynthesis
MLLTEHGIYTKERRIEINRSEWIQDWDSGELVAERKAPFFRRYWIRQFQMMSRITYEYADEILTLYTGNTIEQMKDGADPSRLRVIPNGIDLDRFGEAARKHDARGENERFTVCFVGRVCPIKDVMTFVSAMRLVADEIPNLRVRVLGPMDEDPEYAEMCQRHARALGLDANLAFEGKVNVLEELPKVDLIVLTSISEAQPLVILEAGAVGIPTVATDVGSCAELLYGRHPEDRAVGEGGIVTPMASPGETARAILQLYRDPGLRRRMRDAMRERVRRFYDQRDMVAAYDELYQRFIKIEEPSPVEVV